MTQRLFLTMRFGWRELGEPLSVAPSGDRMALR
jgi:hypothetical protein